MKRAWILPICNVALVASVFANDDIVREAIESNRTSRDLGDIVCGPRCVQYVLKHFGTSVDLVDLIKEEQWPRFELGAPFSLIEDSLRQRGLFTCAVRLRAGTRLHWGYPVILYLPHRDQRNIGHFVVLLPSQGREARVWVGLGGEQIGPFANLVTEGCIALCTSPSAIDNDDVLEMCYVERPTPLWSTGLVFLGVACVVMGVWRVYVRGSRRCRSTSSDS